MNKKIIQSIVAGVVIFFLMVLADLVPFWMPMMGEMLILLLVTICLLVWVGFVLAERAVDEREVYLAMKSSRVAYAAGVLVLVVALVTEGIVGEIDPWVPISLAVLVGSKVLTRLYWE